MIDKITNLSADDAIVDIFYLLACGVVGAIVFFDAWAWIVNMLVKL
ncbi:hypothetical protein [Shewanella surugensis]|uniref:TMhelix containing protein n=1 Tax=Shewanella surugensis TaxID=212020 RepID=A0ABT0LAS7_9GAMM|nr:hypothetical protein [Shewanella surugensis]MCL1124808.1 hypothetical protein [Shewanella surugensis]